MRHEPDEMSSSRVMDLVDSRLQGRQLTVLRQDKLKEAVEKFVDKEVGTHHYIILF